MTAQQTKVKCSGWNTPYRWDRQINPRASEPCRKEAITTINGWPVCRESSHQGQSRIWGLRTKEAATRNAQAREETR